MTTNSLPTKPKDNSRRKGVPARNKVRRQEEAQERAAAYNKLTTMEKIKKLDAGRFTAGKQRTKLLAKLSQENERKKAKQKK